MRYHLFAYYYYDHGNGGKNSYIGSANYKIELEQKYSGEYEFNKTKETFALEIFDSEELTWEEV